jgi:hypothetical protein
MALWFMALVLCKLSLAIALCLSQYLSFDLSQYLSFDLSLSFVLPPPS